MRAPEKGDPVGPPAPLRFETVRSILEDSQGNFWFGSWNEGVCRFDGNTLTYFTAADGLTSQDIMGIYRDRRGDLWLAGNGVFKFNGTSFERFL